MKAFSADPDFSQLVVDDLYRYHRKYLSLARLLVIALGFLGVHRFYLGKTFTASLMLLTGGGCLVWWIVDAFRIKVLVNHYNTQEAQRQKDGEPPQRLAFLPQKKALNINQPPAWVALRNGRLRIYGSLFLLALTGLSLGAISGSTGIFEPTIILFVFIFVSFAAARSEIAGKIPVLASLIRWIHRLRLYYYSVDPGNIWGLALRPVFGIFYALYHKKARAEVRLYLELGLAFSILFLAMDVMQFSEHDSFWAGVGEMLGEFIQTLIYTYLFVAPVGALLTTQILLSRSDWVVWLLGGACLAGLLLGLQLVGAI